jgi:dTDP-4-dehydrorhamnose reductase
MKILLFGKTGQVGTQLARLCPEAEAVDRAGCDLMDAVAVREFVLKARPDWVVNAAAYTAVDKAESDQAACFAVNAEAPRAMAEAARELGIPLIHYSTDYVFNGEKAGSYRESDPTGPLGAYGKSKLEGEHGVVSAGGAAVVLRTSWVYGAEGHNFMRTMLRLGGERPELRVVKDQVGSPTSARAIASATLRIIAATGQGSGQAEGASLVPGVYHMTADGVTSWFGFAEKIFALSTLEKKPKVIPITTAEYPTPARRPKNSALANEKFAAAFGFRLRPWEDLLQEEMAAYERVKG